MKICIFVHHGVFSFLLIPIEPMMHSRCCVDGFFKGAALAKNKQQRVSKDVQCLNPAIAAWPNPNASPTFLTVCPLAYL